MGEHTVCLLYAQTQPALFNTKIQKVYRSLFYDFDAFLSFPMLCFVFMMIFLYFVDAFLRFSYDFPMLFLRFYVFFNGFLMLSICFSYALSVFFWYFSYGFLLVYPYFFQVFLMFSMLFNAFTISAVTCAEIILNTTTSELKNERSMRKTTGMIEKHGKYNTKQSG